ncbi:putative protein kinase RLK-Pelle-DLSV family [Helianthus annuus]|nr:putative protein kinase RLK-Pelle-DLSV family [Helianthus annuus]
MNEASILVKVEHENLIQLLGYCIHGTEVYLIYDFPLNATLDGLIYCNFFLSKFVSLSVLNLILSEFHTDKCLIRHLYVFVDRMCNLLDCNKRYKIILGIARALEYLHRHAPIRIIHLDVKPANILIDESYNPRLSGFGVAVTTSETDCVSLDNVFGTVGNIAPECLTSLRCSTKADVYSFGVLIFETVTGKSIRHLSYLALDRHLGFANYLLDADIIDPRIDADSVLMKKCIDIGILCVQPAEHRPTMEKVVEMLLGTVSPNICMSKMRAWMINQPTSFSEMYQIPDVDLEDYDESVVEEFISELCPR